MVTQNVSTITGNYTPANFAETSLHPFPNGRRRRRSILTDKQTGQKYESYEGEVHETGNVPLKDSSETEFEEYDEYESEFAESEKIPLIQEFPKATDEELKDTSSTRWLMYDGLARLLSSKGIAGRPCVLRGICEAAETKFNHHSGLFGELFHIIFS